MKVGPERPSLVLTTPSIWTGYEALLQPTVRAGYQTGGFPQVTRTGVVASQNALSGADIGFSALWFRGTPVVEDEKCTSQKLFFVNEKHFRFHGIDLGGKVEGYQKFNTSANRVKGPQAMPIPKGFNYSGQIRATDQPATVGHLYYVGNFVSDDPRRLGQLTGVTD